MKIAEKEKRLQYYTITYNLYPYITDWLFTQQYYCNSMHYMVIIFQYHRSNFSPYYCVRQRKLDRIYLACSHLHLVSLSS